MDKIAMGGRAVLAFGASLAALAASTGPALAQEAAESSPQFGDIIVTAERRETKLQDTPIAISAIGSEQIAERGILSIENVQSVTPNLTFGSLNNSTLISLRGVGSELSSLAGETTVSMFEDGVYQGQSFLLSVPSFDLERIEVLRGPQGTLYGRNSTGGTINFITKAPSFDPGMNLELGYGNYDHVTAAAGATGALVEDKIAARASFKFERRDGYRRNLALGTDADALESLNARMTLLFTPSDTFKLTLRGDLTNRDSTEPYLLVNSQFGPSPADVGVAFGLPPGALLQRYTNPNETTDFYNDTPSDSRIRVRGVSGTIEWELSPAVNLRSITAYRDSSMRLSFDNDGSDLPWLISRSTQGAEQFTQEAHLYGTALNDKLDWLVGAFYFDERARALFNFELPLYAAFPAAYNPAHTTVLPDGAPTPATGYVGFFDRQKSKSIAGFVHGNYHLSDRAEFALGARFTHDKKDVVRSVHANIPDATGGPAVATCDNVASSESWNAFTGDATLSYKLQPDMLAFGRVARGYKAGGFNLGDCGPSFDRETLMAYEIGLKSTLLDNQLRANLSLFHYDYKNFQFTQYNASGAIVSNAPAAVIDGVELEFMFAPRALSGLQIDGSGSWLHSEFKGGAIGDPFFPGGPAIDLDGNRLVRAPKWKANIGAQYSFDLGSGGELTFRGETSYSDDYFHDVTNDGFVIKGTHEPSYWISNARIIWKPDDSGLSIQAYIENIENNLYMFARPGSPLQTGIGGNASAPRTYGVKLSAEF